MLRRSAPPDPAAERPRAGASTTQRPVAGPRATAATGRAAATTAGPDTARTPQTLLRLQALAGNRAVAGLLAGAADGPVVVQRKPPVTTPAFPPRPLPPAAYPPRNRPLDTEGNPILITPGGRPYLAERPANLAFPHAAGADFRLFPVNPNRAYQRLRAHCGQLLIQQRQLATRLKGDMKYWFARVYSFVTQYTLEDIDAGKYQYPHMKLQQIVHFHETYERNLEAWEAGQRSKVESNWRAAFAAADDADSMLGASKSIGNALLPSMEAHIRLDLPRAIAAAYQLHYADIPGTSLDAFQQDFFAMSGVFERSQAAIAPEIDAAGTDWNPVNWETLGDIGFVFLFLIDTERRMAWEKATAVARAWGVSREGIERALRAEMGARHPNLEPFEVAGKDITDYDWADQPGTRPDTRAPGRAYEPAPEPPKAGTLYFRLDRPRGGEALEQAVRRDQDLQPLLALAEWTREVHGASIWLIGRASSEGSEVLNTNLAMARAELVRFFLWRAGADFERNTVRTIAFGELGAQATPEHRCVSIWVVDRGQSKQQVFPAAGNLPSEVAP